MTTVSADGGVAGRRAETRVREQSLNLRVGDWVQVRDAEEILATLDDQRCLDKLPFMPEMLQHCGKRFQVYKSAHKTCDTIETYAIRRMRDAVHLDDLRCDGAAHGGCQAGCLLFWKTAWLKRVEGPGENVRTDTTAPTTLGPAASASLEQSTRVLGDDGSVERYQCQATELVKATSEVSRRGRWDPRLYLKDLTSGNVGLKDFLWFGALAAFNAFVNRWMHIRFPLIRGHAGQQTPLCRASFEVGKLVQVRSKREIEDTLNADHRNRGLWFDVEMLPYANGRAYPVLRRVDKIINEKSGRLMTLTNPCVILQGVVCSGFRSERRMFCPRSLYPYWRDNWLKESTPND